MPEKYQQPSLFGTAAAEEETSAVPHRFALAAEDSGTVSDRPIPAAADCSVNTDITRPFDGEATLAAVAARARDCRVCRLRAGCRGVVFGEGSPIARLLFVGEGPGEMEDRLGRPFVGKAGQLLDKILAAAGFERDAVYITNVVKCRPPANRLPLPDEVAACLPLLKQQIGIINPDIVVCLGALATQTLLDPKARITKVRGRLVEKGGRKILPTFHPAALLRDESKKRPVWEDFKLLRTLAAALPDREAGLDRAIAGSKGKD
ncbi:MAG: uracil-DNA glycosylase [bacterium]